MPGRPAGRAGNAAQGFPAAFRPPAFASRASCSRHGLRSPHGRPARQSLDLGGGPRIPRIRVTTGLGASFTPRPSGAHTVRASPIPPAAAGPLSQEPGPITRRAFQRSFCLLRGVIRGSLTFARPAFPSPAGHWMAQRPLGLAPRASHPGRQDPHGARQGGGGHQAPRLAAAPPPSIYESVAQDRRGGVGGEQVVVE
jgi:hypothetical protein